MRVRMWSVPALFISLVMLATPLAAQVTATAQQDLSFGLLVPGVATTVLVDDATRRAEWLLTGRGNTTVSLVLPTELVSVDGVAVPLVFVDGDGGWMRTQGNTAVQPIDPNAPFTVAVPNRQTVRLFLGGTAQPPASTPAGTYTATITLIVAQP